MIESCPSGCHPSTMAVISLEARYDAVKWHSALDFDQVNSYTDPSVLTLSEMRINTVNPINTSLYEACQDRETILLRNLVNSMSKKPLPKTYFTGKDSFNTYWRTNIFDKSCTVGRLDHTLRKSYRQIAASCIAIGSLLQGSNIKEHPFLADLENEYPLFPSSESD